MSITVVVGDDEPVVCSGIALLLGLQPGISVLAETHTAEETVDRAMDLRPDVVVMDVRMPRMGGIEATRVLTGPDNPTGAGAKVLVCTTFPEDDAVYGALRAGASGFLLKHAASADLPAAVRKIAAGDAWLDPAVAGAVFAALSTVPGDGNPAPTLLHRLTNREREVLALIARGKDNTEISAELVLSIATVKTHVSRILIKTGCRDRAGAVVLAYESGLVRPGRPAPPSDQ